jgi:hypothetical protein
LVFIQKKVIQNLKKITETGSNRPVLIRFGFLGQKPVQIGLAQFFGSVWFFRFGFGSVFSVLDF